MTTTGRRGAPSPHNSSMCTLLDECRRRRKRRSRPFDRVPWTTHQSHHDRRTGNEHPAVVPAPGKKTQGLRTEALEIYSANIAFREDADWNDADRLAAYADPGERPIQAIHSSCKAAPSASRRS